MSYGVPSAIRVGGHTYTCKQIADGAGLHISLVSRIFRGKRKPSLYAAHRLASFLRISIEDLLAVAKVQVRMPRFPARRGRVINEAFDPLSRDRNGRPLVVKTYAPCQAAGTQFSAQISPELQEWLRAHLRKGQ
jgi:transcriptional regulator with XRE-family HTH domain